MDTIVSNWQVVSVKEGDNLIGKVLWGTCIEDWSFRFWKGD